MEVSTISGPILFGVYYRPPTQGVYEMTALSNCLLSIGKLPIILCGDFNMPNIVVFPTVSTPLNNEFCDLVQENCLTQMVSTTGQHNLLDLVLTNRPHLISKVCVVDNLPSTDHDAILFLLNITVSVESPCKRVLYNYKRADMSVFLETLSHVPWHIIESVSDFEESWQLFKDLFFSVLDISIPRLKWKKSKLKHWFSQETIHSVRRKRRLYLRIKSLPNPSPSLLSKYRTLSNKVRSMTRRDTKLYADRVCQDCYKNPKRFWAWLNSSKNSRTQIPPITVAGEQLTDTRTKANEFNQFFHSVFTKERTSDLPSQGSHLSFLNL